MVVLLIFVLIGCENDNTSDLDGHWHLTHESGYPVEFGTVDISDTVIVWGQSATNNDLRSRVDKINKKIFHSPMYIPYAYDYKLNNDSLWLKLEGEEQYEIFGIKITGECSLEADYFHNNIIDLNLPVIEKSSDIDMQYFWVNLRLFLGKPKPFVQEIYGDSISFSNSERVVPLNYKELELLNLKHDVKLPRNRVEKISTLIFTDSNTPMQKLDHLLSLQRFVNSRKIFLVGKRQDDKGEKQLSFLLLEEELKFNKDATVGDWLQPKE